MSYQKFTLQRFERQLYRFEKMFEDDHKGDLCWRGRPEDKDQAFVVLEGLYGIYVELYKLEPEDEEEVEDATLVTGVPEGIPPQVQATEAKTLKIRHYQVAKAPSEMN